MQFFYGIEASPVFTELPEFQQFLHAEAPPHLVHGNIYIYRLQQMAEAASELLSEADLHEETHLLIKAEGTAGADFYDYGFITGTETYLYADALSAFRFTEGSSTQTRMAFIQLEEHLVFTCSEGIHFTPKHYTELVLGIVKAYEVKVVFLDLDK